MASKHYSEVITVEKNLAGVTRNPFHNVLIIFVWVLNPLLGGERVDLDVTRVGEGETGTC